MKSIVLRSTSTEIKNDLYNYKKTVGRNDELIYNNKNTNIFSFYYLLKIRLP